MGTSENAGADLELVAECARRGPEPNPCCTTSTDLSRFIESITILKPPGVSLELNPDLPRPQNADVPLERLGFYELWSILKRNLLLACIVVALCMGLSIAISLQLEKRYFTQATIALEVADTRVNLPDAMIEATEMNQAEVETQLDIMRSREFAGKVVDSLGLINDPTFNPSLSAESQGTQGPEAQRDAVIGKLLRSYSVGRSGESFAVDINVSHTNPETAAAIANAVAQLYIDESVAFKRDVARQSIDFLRTRVEVLSQSLNDTEINIASFVRANNLDNLELPAQLRAELEKQRSILELAISGQEPAQDISAVEADLEQIETQLRDRTRAELTLRQMERTLETERNRFQTYVERLNALEALVDILAPGARQVSFAEPPNEPSAPNIPQVLLVSLAAALALGMIAALIRENMDRRVWSERHAARASGLPTIAQIPRIKLQRPDAPGSLAQYLRTHPRSALNESIRSLLTLCYQNKRATSGVVLMVTSGLPNEGKSSVALALGHCAASGGMRTLLVDFDSRRHGLGKMLDLPEYAHQVEDVFFDPALLDVSIKRSMLFESLDVLGFRRNSDLPWSLMFDREAKLNFNRLRGRYDVIIVDTPPVLLVDDACRLSPATDKTIVVTRWGRTSQEALKDCAEVLRKNGVSVIGTVINDVDVKKQSWYGYGGRASYYAQGGDYFS